MSLQPLPDISRIPPAAAEPLDLLYGLVDGSIPPEIRSVLTGFLTDGLIGGMDAVVFNSLPALPESLSGLAGSLYTQLKSGSFDISSTAKQVLDTFVLDGSTDALTSLASKGFELLSPDILNGLSGATQLLQQFGNLTDFSIPGLGIVKTASTLMSALGLKSDLGSLLGQGLGIAGGIAALGSPAALVANLIAPSVSKIFGGALGGTDPQSQCPCLESCRKTDHFITEDSTNLLRTCAPVMVTSLSSSESLLSSIF